MRSPIPKTLLRSQKVTLAFAIVLLVVLVGATSLIVHQRTRSVVQPINYSQLYQIAEAESATALSIEGETLTVTKRDGSVSVATVTNEAAQQNVVEAFRKHNVPVEFRPIQAGLAVTALHWITPVVTLLLLAFVGWRVHASVSGRNEQFAQPKSSEVNKNVSFADVAGVDEAKAELAETIEFLRDPDKFGRLGGRAPRGILLSGPPGTGKTLLARAAANEAGVPFLSVSGSSFQEKFVGVGAARVRRLFVEGRKLSPCIIFIDEIDALGRQRGRSNDSASADQD